MNEPTVERRATKIAYRGTLKSGKKVMILQPTIEDMEDSARLAGGASSNNMHMGLLLQKELVKRVLVSVDDKKLALSEKENLDNLFDLKEYMQLIKAVTNLTGDTDALGKDMELELVMV